MNTDPDQPADYALQQMAGEDRRRDSLIRHLRERHMRPPMQTWVSRCRWCGLVSWWELIKEPASRLTQDDLLLRVRRLEEQADQSDGTLRGPNASGGPET